MWQDRNALQAHGQATGAFVRKVHRKTEKDVREDNKAEGERGKKNSEIRGEGRTQKGMC